MMSSKRLVSTSCWDDFYRSNEWLVRAGTKAAARMASEKEGSRHQGASACKTKTSKSNKSHKIDPIRSNAKAELLEERRQWILDYCQD